VNRFQARVPFEAHHPTALALWCSDGRFTRAVEELLESLGQPRLDTMTFPGGPALLEMTSSSLVSVENAREAASFLIKAHSIKDVVLIAHEGCGYYRARYRYESSEAMQRRQFADLRSAARWVSGTHPGVMARCFFAGVASTPNGPRVTFSPVE
jgi:hypothetical protein